MRLVAALTGSLREHMAAEMAAAENAVTGAIREAVEGTKADMRRQMVQGGLGQRLAKAWRGEVYPKREPSIRAAGMVWTKAPKLMTAFGDNTLIRSKDGFWLAIPTENAPKRGVGGKRISPGNFPEHRFGPLRFVYRGGKTALLVADNLRARKGKTGGFGKASAAAQRRGEIASAVMFVLVPQARLRKRIDFARAAEQWGGRLPSMIVDRWTAATAR